MYQMRSKVLGSRTDTHGNLKLTGALDYLQDCSLQWLESEQSFSDFLSEKMQGCSWSLDKLMSDECRNTAKI